MYQMNSKIHPRKPQRAPRKGEPMKTASLTAPGYLNGDRGRESVWRYLPHALIAALLFALLAFAGHTASESGQPTGPVVSHMGQR